MRCSETGDLGFCKPTDIAQEKICSDLALAVGVKVPEVRLGDARFAGKVAVSVIFGKESQDIAMLRDRFPEIFNSEPVTVALRAASGLLAFHAWVGTGDLKDDHLLCTSDNDGVWSVAAIDFASALGWRSSDAQPPAVVAPPGPPALVSTVDQDVIEKTVSRIEAMADSELSVIVEALPDPVISAAERGRIVKGLQIRRSQVRGALRPKGWIP